MLDMDRAPLSREFDDEDAHTMKPLSIFDETTEVGNSDWLNDAVYRALQCIPGQQYGCGGPPPGTNLPPPPNVAPCNDGNMGKVSYVTAVFPAGTFPLAAGASATATVQVETGFKGERMILPVAIAAAVSVDSIKVQNQEQLSTPPTTAGQGVNGGTFLATNDGGPGRVTMKTCKENGRISVTVTNTSGAPIAAPGANVDFLGVLS